MAKQISLLLLIALLITIATYRRSLTQLAPHLLHHLLS